MLDPNRDPGVSEHRGLALGLRLARAVTALHGGKVDVMKKANVGGAFLVTLPISTEAWKARNSDASRPV